MIANVINHARPPITYRLDETEARYRQKEKERKRKGQEGEEEELEEGGEFDDL